MMEIAIIAVVALLVFGPKRLPEMGRSLGRGMREFKTTVSGGSPDEDLFAIPVGVEEEDAPRRRR